MSRKQGGRTKGSGYIFKRGNIYYLQYDVKGQRKTVSLHCKTKREAEAKSKELLEPLKNADTRKKLAAFKEEALNLVKKNKTVLENVWELYLKNPTRPDSSSGTLKNYEGQWNRFKNWLLKTQPAVSTLSEVNDDIAHEYADDLWCSGISAKTYNNHIKALMLIFRILSYTTGSNHNPWLCISRKIETKQSRKEFSEEDVLKILDSLNKPKLHLLHKEEMTVLFHLGAWTGLRFIDCVLMKWENIDFARNLITCKPQKTARKTNKRVTVPMHPILRQFFEKALEWQENEYVLPKVAKRYQENSDCVNKDVIKVFEFNGFETTKEVEGVQRKRKANVYGFHSFRHSFVSFCAKAGVPMPVVQAIVGHGNPAITRHYIHIGEESVKQAINALPQGNLLSESKNKKTAEEKNSEIVALLNAKTQLTETEMQILKILQ
jgi:integrase